MAALGKGMATQHAPMPFQSPRSTPKRSTASIAYSEQVGSVAARWQEAGRNGPLVSPEQQQHGLLGATIQLSSGSRTGLCSADFLNHFKGPATSCSTVRRIPRCSSDFLGLMTTSTAEHHCRTRQPHRLAQPALHAVAIDRAAQSPAYGKSDPAASPSRSRVDRPPANKRQSCARQSGAGPACKLARNPRGATAAHSGGNFAPLVRSRDD